MIFPAQEITPGEMEQMFRENALPMPAGYTHLGLAFVNGLPSLVVVADDLPAMVWRDGQWMRAAPVPTDG
jgi:hypothetical protein